MSALVPTNTKWGWLLPLIWEKARPLALHDADRYRADAHRRVIRADAYGDRNDPEGWEVDHYPVAQALGGSDDISNLRPLHCQGNAALGGLLGAVMSAGQGALGSPTSTLRKPPAGQGLRSIVASPGTPNAGQGLLGSLPVTDGAGQQPRTLGDILAEALRASRR
jgi:hypothetical protein